MSIAKNLFIAFEGIDGSGKSSQIKLLSEYLKAHGHKVFTTMEPTDHPIGKMIRNIFAHRMEGDQRVIASLFAADRLNHLLDSKEGILKKLEEGYTVITDRYYLSSFAYHSVFVDMDWVFQLNSESVKLRRPDYYIYLDVDPNISMDRLSARQELEMYETLEQQKKVYANYQKAIEIIKNEENIISINGNQDINTINNSIIKSIFTQ